MSSRSSRRDVVAGQVVVAPLSLEGRLLDYSDYSANPPTTTTTTAAEDRRPCAICGELFPIEGPGSSWPWTSGRRICVPCLQAHDREAAS